MPDASRLRMLIGTALLLCAVLAPSLVDAAPTYRTETRLELHPGVVWEQVRADAGPQLYINVAKIDASARVALQPVLSNEEVYEYAPKRRMELTTSMCRRSGGVVCVNADFPVTLASGEPTGGLVIGRVPMRSPSHQHEQLSILDDGAIVAERWVFDVRLVAIFDETSSDHPFVAQGNREYVLGIDELNRRTDDGITLYTPAWGERTQTPEGAIGAAFTGPIPDLGTRTAATPGPAVGHNALIPGNGFVVSASGSGVSRWNTAIDRLRGADRLELRIDASLPLEMSVGGQPVILDRGHRLSQDMERGFIRNRHPRTLVGWNDAGDTWLVTVDGRQKGHSDGVSIAEAADYLESLGATTAINLDGGGSTAFVTNHACGDGTSPCVRNLPSDGRERYVSSALAVVPVGPAAVAEAPPTPTTVIPPTTTTSTPPTTAPKASTTVAPTTAPPTTAPPTTLPAVEATLTEPTTTTTMFVAEPTPTTVPPPTTTPPVADEVASAPISDPRDTVSDSTVAALFALILIVSSAAFGGRLYHLTRRRR